MHYVRAWDKLYIKFQPMEGNPYMYLNRTRAHARLVLPTFLMLALALVMHATPALADEAIEPVSDVIVDPAAEVATSDGGDVIVEGDEDALVPDDDVVPTDDDAQAETVDPAVEVTTVPDGEPDDATMTDSVETDEPIEPADETSAAPAEELLSATAPIDDLADASDTTDPEPEPEPTGRWWVGNLGNGLQRYWLVDDVPVVDQLIDLGDGTFAYARPEGYVVRGRWCDPRTGYVYLADNNGVLLKAGWSVSKSFGQGTQRYYVDPVAHACVPGYSKDGWQHYTTTSGYVARGSFKDADGMTSYANANGLVTGYFPTRLNGWVVTNAYGQGTQRYWLTNGLATRGKLVQTGSSSWAYARPEGYVVRGRWADPTTGYVYLANNNGVLLKAGWTVSKEFGQGTQRYYVDPDAHACVPGYSTDGWRHFTTTAGYVARGSFTDLDGARSSANGNGLVTGYFPTRLNGWVVTNAYGQGTQRYWMVGGRIARGHLVQTSDTSWAYARPEGYVVRGLWADPKTGYVYLANNNGLLERTGWRVSSAYGQGAQRYYVDDVAHACVPGYSTKGWAHVTVAAGYVLRNGYAVCDAQLYRANNDGRLSSATVGGIALEDFGYFQQDRRWKSIGMPNGSTIGPNGCGPVALSMAVSIVTGSQVLPSTFVRQINATGIHYGGYGGSELSLLQEAGLRVMGSKLTMTMYDNYSYEDLCRALSSGGVVILHGYGTFHNYDGSTGRYGHYVCAYGITDDGKIMIKDPMSHSGDGATNPGHSEYTWEEWAPFKKGHRDHFLLVAAK